MYRGNYYADVIAGAYVFGDSQNKCVLRKKISTIPVISFDSQELTVIILCYLLKLT